MTPIRKRILLCIAAMASATFVWAADPPKSGSTADTQMPSGYAAPNGLEELGARLQQLRVEYAPYLRSLPTEVDPRGARPA